MRLPCGALPTLLDLTESLQIGTVIKAVCIQDNLTRKNTGKSELNDTAKTTSTSQGQFGHLQFQEIYHWLSSRPGAGDTP